MLNRIKTILFAGAAKGRDPRSAGDLELAAAALLVEAAVLDGDFADAERAAIHRLLEGRFKLDPREAADLVRDAEDAVANANELYTLSRTVKDNFDHEDRVDLLEMAWQVAYADGVVHDYEANLMRRLAGLLYVSDRENGEARKRAAAKIGLE
ncbi:MAG: TerB family tellurite resistance protein [Alphaproteobacteria bacterium]|nr:TerB family tellurite resistance protein [Alphaproteobacteria bacterium]MBF0251014.1 TerB family tellurite resistance protein [Alphaproteobacteria bacterium]